MKKILMVENEDSCLEKLMICGTVMIISFTQEVKLMDLMLKNDGSFTKHDELSTKHDGFSTKMMDFLLK